MKLFWVVLLACLLNCSQTLLYADDKPIETDVKTEKDEPSVRPIAGVASGVKSVGSGAKDLVTETVHETATGRPIEGTVKGIQKGSEKLVDSTVKGVYKAATLGQDLESYEFEAPRAVNTSENTRSAGDPGKFKIKIPGS